MNIKNLNDMRIESVEQLWDVLPEVFQNHTQKHEDQLPTVSFDALTQEFNTAANLYNGETPTENYVPAYYGCGIIARALAIAHEDGHDIGNIFNNIPRY
jgi:hypothetical protein